MEKIFDDMLTTQDTTRYMGENNGKQITKNHKNASEVDAPKKYGKQPTTTVMDSGNCKRKKKK